MLILTKSIISMLLGFIMALIFGFIIIPIFKNNDVGQVVSKNINERHLKKNGTPTMGGIIFIIPTILLIIFLILNKNIELTYNFFSLLITFFMYGLLGFIDDFIKIKLKNNNGLSILSKLTIEIFISVIFFLLYLLSGNNTIISIFNYSIDLKFLYGILLFFIFTGCTNAVNITDGLDGLCAGLSLIAFVTYGIIAWNSDYILGYNEIAIFCFILSGALMGFLFFNFYPAKIFMGDLGSLALGAALACVSIILKKELSLLIIGFVFIIEILSSFFQIVSIRIFKKKIFKKSPLHHHFEEYSLCESDILKLFYLFGLFCALIAIIIYVWI